MTLVRQAQRSVMWMRFVQWTVDIYRDSVLNAAVLMDTVEKDARVRSN